MTRYMSYDSRSLVLLYTWYYICHSFLAFGLFYKQGCHSLAYKKFPDFPGSQKRQSFCPEPPSLEDHCKARRYAPVVEHATLLLLGPGNFWKKSRTFQEAWEPCIKQTSSNCSFPSIRKSWSQLTQVHN